jgi:hypothetical protein
MLVTFKFIINLLVIGMECACRVGVGSNRSSRGHFFRAGDDQPIGSDSQRGGRRFRRSPFVSSSGSLALNEAVRGVPIKRRRDRDQRWSL